MEKAIRLHIEAPLMSFGTSESQWDIYKDTKMMPTKSAIVGMIGCALGYQRQSVELNNLEKNIEITVTSIIDTEEDFFKGLKNDILYDFQILSTDRSDQFMLSKDDTGFNLANGTRSKDKNRNIVRKNYIEDAAFEVMIKADDKLISEIYHALRHPYYPYYFGRACCIPACEVVRRTEEESCI